MWFLILLASSLCYVSAVEYDRTKEGYPNSFWTHCHGAELKAEISDKTVKQLRFVVHGPEYKQTYTYFTAMKRLLKDPHIDVNKRTMFFVSGYLDSAEFILPALVANAYSKRNYNTILIDTNRFTTMFYTVASRLSRPVGMRVAELLAALTRQGLDPGKVEMVGLSLGCHTIGFVGKHYQKLTGRKLSRLTGLDPASPCFRTLSSDNRLNTTDADFVDIIHTNIDGMGVATPIGHVNFYVNGGEWQPGSMEWLPCDVLCSHLRSFWLWLSAIAHKKDFIGMECASVQDARDNNCYDKKPKVTNVMGLETDRKKTGIFYLPTTNTPPYYLGEKGLQRAYNAWQVFGSTYNKEDVLVV